MKKWEYKTTYLTIEWKSFWEVNNSLKLHIDEQNAHLNKEGSEGWDLVSKDQLDSSEPFHLFYWKRPKLVETEAKELPTDEKVKGRISPTGYEYDE